MNRVKDYYNVILNFNKLTPMAKTIIGTHLRLLDLEAYKSLPEDELSAKVILAVMDKNVFTEFSQIVTNYTKVMSNDITKQ